MKRSKTELRFDDWNFQEKQRKNKPTIFASGMTIEQSKTRMAIPFVPLIHNSTTPCQIVLLLLPPKLLIERIGSMFAGTKRINAASDKAIVL